MAFEYHLPDLAEGMIEAEVVAWKVSLGDKIDLDQLVVEILTDKATMEIPSPAAGVLSKINYDPGETCAVGAVLFVIEDVAEAGAAPPVAAASPPPSDRAVDDVHARPTTQIQRPEPPSQVEVIDATVDRPRVLATPATRRLARRLGVDLSRVKGSGRRGRVTSADVEAFAQPGASAPAPTSAAPMSARGPAQPISIPASEGEERIPFRGVRKLIADNMTRSMFTATHFTYVEEVDVTELVALRDQAKDKVAAKGIKLTYLPFIMKAVVAGLKKYPALNASLDEVSAEIVRKGYYHIGVAAQGPQGLMVTVVRDADRRSILGLASEVARLSACVQEGRVAREELTGSTFTISSLGKLGGLHATPILNFPEVGILGVHKIEQRAAVVDGQVVPRWRMNLSISLDHRLVDGWDGAMFLQEIKEMLEDPTLMFMEMV